MFRIKLGSGDESVFDSFEELAFGIGTGVIGPDAQIYHDRAEKWLPVTVHPAYKKAVGAAPPPTNGAAESNGAHGPSAEPDPVASPPKSDGQDLMTLLDLGDLDQSDSGNVQESAAPQDPAPAPAEPEPAEPPEAIETVEAVVEAHSEAIEEEAAAPDALDPPRSAESSDMVDLPPVEPVENDEDPASTEEAESADPSAGLEFLSVDVADHSTDDHESTVEETEPVAESDPLDDSLEVEAQEPAAARLSDFIEVSASDDEFSTQALDSVMDEPLPVTEESPVPAAELDADEQEEEAEDEEGLKVESAFEASTSEADEADDDLVADDPEQQDDEAEVTASHDADEEEQPEVQEEPQIEEAPLAALEDEDDPIASFQPESFEPVPELSARMPGSSRKPS